MQANIDTGFSQSSLSTASHLSNKEMTINEKDFHRFLLIRRGLAENSIRHCMIRIRKINMWLETNELTKESMEGFFMGLKDKGLKNNSLNTYKFVLSQLVEYCKDRGLQSDFLEGFKSFKKTKPDIIILTPEEIEKIIDTPLTYGKLQGVDCSFLDFRYRTLIRFLASTGCRFSEAKNLTIKHLDLSAGRAILIETKTNENRSVFFSEALASELKELIAGFKEIDLVFRNSKESKINETDFSNDLKRRAKEAGISKRVYPHLFRHSFATQLLIEGIDVALVSKILGHKDIRTTVENYLHLADETLKDATYMHPLNRKYINPYFLIKSAKETFERFHFERDERFHYSLSEEGNSLKFEIFLKD